MYAQGYVEPGSVSAPGHVHVPHDRDFEIPDDETDANFNESLHYGYGFTSHGASPAHTLYRQTLLAKPWGVVSDGGISHAVRILGVSAGPRRRALSPVPHF